MSAVPGIVHRVSPCASAYEISGRRRTSASDDDKTRPMLLFVAGLGDMLLSVEYVVGLAAAVDDQGWRCGQALLSSNGAGWGTASVKQDAEELAQIVRYFKSRGTRKVVLLGHSTGCQDAIAYLHLAASEVRMHKLDAVILQAPVSDREAPGVSEGVSRFQSQLDAKENTSAFSPPELASLLQTNIGITLTRFRSLVLPPPKHTVNLDVCEDFFSSDLSDLYLERVFAPTTCPIMFVLSGDDASYPERIKSRLPDLLERFRRATPSPFFSRHSCILPDADHSLSSTASADAFTQKVVAFLGEL